MHFETIATYLSYAAVLVTCIGYVRTNDNFLRGCIAISSGLLSLHFALLLHWIPAISLLINAIRNQVSRYRTGIKWFLIFATIQILISSLMFDRIKDLLPIIASLISGYAVFCANGMKLRILMLVCTLMWFVHNIFYAALGAIILDTIGIASNCYGMYKLNRNGVKK